MLDPTTTTFPITAGAALIWTSRGTSVGFSGMTTSSPFLPKSLHRAPVRASRAKSRRSLVAMKRRSAHVDPLWGTGSLHRARPRQLNLFAGVTETSICASKTQISRPVAGSRAATRLKGVQNTNFPSAMIGVASNLDSLITFPRRAISPVR